MGNEENPPRVSRFAAFFRVSATDDARQSAPSSTPENGVVQNQEENSTKDSSGVGCHAGEEDNDINNRTLNMDSEIGSSDIQDNNDVHNPAPNTYEQAGSMETGEENGINMTSSSSTSLRPYGHPSTARYPREYTTAHWQTNTRRIGFRFTSQEQPHRLVAVHEVSRNWRRPLASEQANLLTTANASSEVENIRNEINSRSSGDYRDSTLQSLRGIGNAQFGTGTFDVEEVDDSSRSNRSFRFSRREASGEGFSSNRSSVSGAAIRFRNRFRPSYAALGVEAPINEELAQKAKKLGLDKGNYKGSITQYTLDNIGCTEEENCAVRIENISAYALLKDIFAVIRTGKVYSFYLQLPDGVHSTCAAQLVFMTREAAAKFVEQGNSEDGLVVRDRRLRVWLNRDMARPVDEFKLEQSRVVRFEGPKDSLSFIILKDLFKGNIEYEMVEDSIEEITGDMIVVEMSFACVRAQAESALVLFYAHFSRSDIRHLVRGWYAHDPCNPERDN